MSGVSLAVGPRDEPDKTTTTLQKTEQKPPLNQRQQQSVGGDVLGSLRVIELQLVAFIMVFSASGLVPLLDLVFPAFASAYLLALSRLAFPAHGRSSPVSQELFQSSKFFRFSVILGATVGLFLPLAYVLGGFARGDEHAVRSATPHLFLLSFQILTENVISRLSLFSPPVRALVPLLYTVRRIFLIIDWITDVWFNKTLPSNMEVKVNAKSNCDWQFVFDLFSISLSSNTLVCLCAGHGMALVRKDSCSCQSIVLGDQSVLLSDSAVPSSSFREVLQGER